MSWEHPDTSSAATMAAINVFMFMTVRALPHNVRWEVSEPFGRYLSQRPNLICCFDPADFLIGSKRKGVEARTVCGVHFVRRETSDGYIEALKLASLVVDDEGEGLQAFDVVL